MIPQLEVPPPPPAPAPPERQRLLRAFILAPIISLTLFVMYSLCPGFSCDLRINDIPELVPLFVLGIAAGAIPVMLATALLAYPIYLRLPRNRIAATGMIVVSSFMIGVVTMFAFLLVSGADNVFSINDPDFRDTVPPAGVCGAIGGIVFCRLIIWRKPEIDGASDASN